MGLPVTTGSGATIAADVIGAPAAPSSGQYLSYGKIDGGTAGASAPIENGSATNLAATSAVKSLMTVLPGQWVEYHAPAVNTQATKSKAAGGAGVRHVCTWVSFTLAQNSTGSAQTLIAFNLRDGATGAGTILASWTMALPATACECRTFTLTGLNIPGSANTAMTLETAAAPAAQTAASVQFGGYSVT